MRSPQTISNFQSYNEYHGVDKGILTATLVLKSKRKKERDDDGDDDDQDRDHHHHDPNPNLNGSIKAKYNK